MALTDTFDLQKTIWTEADFEAMGWHDCRIHGMAFEHRTFELYLDIDYLFAWINPEPPEEYYTFWVAPCTMVFANVHGLNMDIGTGPSLEIDNLSREMVGRPKNADYIKRDEEWRWVLSCQEGEISFQSVGYKLYVRRRPVQIRTQCLEWSERGSVSFDRVTFGA
jgi:hypothetical protein